MDYLYLLQLYHYEAQKTWKMKSDLFMKTFSAINIVKLQVFYNILFEKLEMLVLLSQALPLTM